jgi:hypothetical protein
MTAPVRNFIRHYAEMVAAMFAGMIVLYLPAEGALRAIGSSASQLQADAPAAVLLGMAAIMTGPMVAWMRYRGHSWRPCWEMSASMFLPTFAAIGLLAAGGVGFHGAMGLEHIAMFPSMLVAMLLRPSEYTGHHAHRAAAVEPAKQVEYEVAA